MKTAALQNISIPRPTNKSQGYPRYKPTGVDWLGNVPEHWEVKRLKHLASIRAGENITALLFDDNGRYSVYGGNGIRGKTSAFTHDGEFVLIGRQGALCGNVHRVHGPFWASEHAAVATCRDGVNIDWFAYLAEAMELKRYSETAAQPGLSMERIVRLRVPFPRPDEQRAIAAFLDCETAKVDDLIASKQRLISVLRQSREVSVSRAITRGLDDTATLRPSGFPWLGDVPQGWEVIPLKRVLASSEYGISDSLKEVGSIAVLRMGNVQDGAIDMGDLRYTDDITPDLVLTENDILFNRTNSLALIGKAALYRPISDEPVTFASYLVRLRTNQRMLPEYLCYLLNRPETLDRARALAIPAIGQANLNPNRYGYMSVCVPPLAEQLAIIHHIDAISLKIRKAAKQVAAAIGKLRELRSSLISSAITGQIDVRKCGEEAPCR